MEAIANTFASPELETVLVTFEQFPFDRDVAFQAGVSAIVEGARAQNKSEIEIEELVCKAKVFYFTRQTGIELSVDDVLARQRSTRSAIVMGHTDDGAEPKPLSFDEIIKLVESGRTEDIPNNKTISTDLHNAPTTTSTATRRAKPWESVAVSVDE